MDFVFLLAVFWLNVGEEWVKSWRFFCAVFIQFM